MCHQICSRSSNPPTLVLPAPLHRRIHTPLLPIWRQTFNPPISANSFLTTCTSTFCAILATAGFYHGAICLYVSAIHFWHLEPGQTDPTVDAPLLHYLLQAIDNVQGNTQPTHQPISITIIKAIKNQLAHSPHLSLHSKHLLWAACTLAFLGFLRSAEFCTPASSSFNPGVHLCQTDVLIVQRNKSLQVLIKASKTDLSRKSTYILIGTTNTSICPVMAMSKFFTLCKNTPSPTPLFTFTYGSFLTCATFQTQLRALLAASGIDRPTCKLIVSA